jgi:hypothetical protein
MKNNNNVFIKTDDNKIINKNFIKWIKKIDNCMHICIKADGCNILSNTTHKVCKLNNENNYNKLNKFFE